MLNILFCTLGIFFIVRQIVIAYYRKKWSFVSTVLCCFFACLSALLIPHALHSFSIETFAWTAGILSSVLCYDVYHLKEGTFAFSKVRALCGLSFSVFALLLIFSLSLPHLYRSETLLHIHMTAEKKQEVISWKTPSGSLMTQKVTAYRIEIKDGQGSVLFDDYLYGDLATIRLKFITFPRWMQWIGFPSLWQPDLISTDYLSLKKKNSGPTQSYFLNSQKKNLWQKIVWGFWDTIFFYENNFFFMHSCSLNSVHLPLLDKRGSPIKGSFLMQLSAESKVPYLSKDR